VTKTFLTALLLWACTASAPLPDLIAAEHSARAHDWDGAIAKFRAAQVSCLRLTPPRRARAACSEALLGEGETLDDAGRAPDAIAVYLAIPPRAPDDATAATATYRAGTLLLRAHREVEAWTALWKVVTDWPDEPTAADALQTLVEDGRKRDARALADQLAKLLTSLAETKVGDNLLWWLADLDEHELARPDTARTLYDRIPTDYPQSGLRDDARWRGANLSRTLGDSPGAVARLRLLLATREVSLLAGSYFSIWLDDAQLLLGQILRDDLHDARGAIAAFRKLPKDYPQSVLRDDALYELAVTLASTGDHTAACTAVRDLVKLEPDSKYVPRTRELGCP
jgi:tetratricopeptide (TPR) repeat protein